MVVHEATPCVLGLGGEKFLNLVAAIAADHDGIEEMRALAQAGDDEVFNVVGAAGDAANRALIDPSLVVDGLSVEVIEALFGIIGKLVHHGVATVLAECVFDDAFTTAVGF